MVADGGLAAVGASQVTRALHPGAWLAWLVGGSVVALTTSNPLYLALVLLVGCGVYLSVLDSAKGRALRPFVALGLVLATLSVPFNVLTGSSGPTVLATLPELSFPRWFGGVALGGEITGEGLVAATGRALAIATLVLLAASFNAAVDHFRLLRLFPRALSQLALPMTIAVLIVPQAVAHARAVAESRRLRGRAGRGLRALPAVLLPVLQGALERSVQRAESLDARGLAGGAPRAGRMEMLAGVVGLGLVAWGAFAHYYYGPGLAPIGAVVPGAGLLALALWRGGGPAGDRLRVDRWAAGDYAVAGSAALAVVLLLGFRFAGVGEVTYLPYPAVTAPAFHPAFAAALLLLLLPALPLASRLEADP